jgi:hypothetical protein
MTYIAIPLEKLEVVRLQTRASLKDLEKRTNKQYKIRTFYLGPRKIRADGGRQGTTNKTDAYAAKLAIYEIKRYDPISGAKGYFYNNLVTYV